MRFANPKNRKFSALPGKLKALAGLAAFGLSVAPNAQEVPLGFTAGPGETVEHDSNFYRSSGVAGSASVMPATLYLSNLVGSFHQIYGREDVTATATIGRALYANLSQFDFTQQDIRAAVHSQLMFNIDAKIDFERSASLAHFADLGTTARDVIDHNQVHGLVDFPVAVGWRALVEGTGSRQQNSYGPFQTQNLNDNALDGGIRYQPTSGNHIDLLLRSEIGSYPNGSPSVFISPGFHERDADLRVDWTFSGASHALGHAGFARRQNDDLVYYEQAHIGPARRAAVFPLHNDASSSGLASVPVDLNRNFSGPVYDLTFLWQVTAASGLTLYAARQEGAAGDNSYLSAVTKTFRISPSYQLSAKVQMDAYWEWSQRNYFSNIYAVINGLAPGATRLDNSHNAGLKAQWSPRRWLQCSLDLHRESRDSTVSIWTYSDTVTTLTAQTTF